jgi:peroxiredoxin
MTQALGVGLSMPDFTMTAADGTTASFTAERGEVETVAYFLRSSTCAICLKHAQTLAELARTGRLGDRKLMLIVPGAADEAKTLTARVKSDVASMWASGMAHSAAGLGTFLSLQHSGTFVVDAGGTISYSKTATIPQRSFDEAALLSTLGG